MSILNAERGNYYIALFPIIHNKIEAQHILTLSFSQNVVHTIESVIILALLLCLEAILTLIPLIQDTRLR